MTDKRKASKKAPGEPRAKRSTKSKETRVEDCPDYLPSPTLTFDHTEWVQQFQDDYNIRLGNKGKRDGAYSWVRSHVTGLFMDKFFPELSSAHSEEFRPYVEATINTRLNNRSHLTDAPDPTEDGGVPSAPMYVWLRDNQEEFDKVWIPMCKKDPKLNASAGPRRSLVSKMWGKLTEAQQLPYKTQWEEMKQEAKTRVVEGKDKLSFLGTMARRVSSMARRAEDRAKVFMEARLAIEVDGVLHVKQVGSLLGDKYLASEGGTTALTSLHDWLATQIDALSSKPEPDVAATPMRDQHMRPLVPNLDEHRPVLQLLRSMVRTTKSAIWQLHGGVGSVPYKKILEALDAGDYSWIPKESLREGAPWKESGYLTKDECLAWLKHLANWNFGASATDFHFAKVYADSGNPRPAHPEAVSISETTRGGQSAWLAVYDKPIKHPQNVHPIYYPRASWEYLYFLLDQPPGLNHWFGLPSRSESELSSFKPISDEEYATILLIFDGADQETRDLISDILISTNDMESKMPVWTEEGMWAKVEGRTVVPPILPPIRPTSNEAGLLFWHNQWMCIEYYQRARLYAADLTRFDFLETYFEQAVKDGPGFHARSKTLIGGMNGVVWLVRAIVKIIANILAILDNSGVTFDAPLPAGYETKRLGSGQLALAMDWACDLLAAIQKSTEVLAKTWAERCRPADADADDNTPSDDAPSPLAFNENTFDNPPHASGSGSRVSSSKPARLTVQDDDDDDDDNDAEAFDLGDDTTSEEEMDELDKKGKGVRKSKGKGKQVPKTVPAATTKQTSKPGNTGKRRGKGKGQEQTGEDDNESNSTVRNLPDLPDVPADIPEYPVEYLATVPPYSAEVQAYLAQNEKLEAFWKKERSKTNDNYHRFLQNNFQKRWDAPEQITDPPLPPLVERRALFRQRMAAWEDKDWMFDIPIVCKPVLPSTVPPDQLEHAFDSYVQGLKKSLEKWTEAADIWADPFSPEMIKTAIDWARMVPTAYPRLSYALALHSELVEECRQSYNRGMRRDLQVMHTKLGEGTALLRRAKVLQAAGELPPLPVGIIHEAHSLVWTVHCMFTQYADREALAVHYRNRMRDAYDDVQVRLRLEELIGLSTLLEEWTEKANALYKAQDAQMLEDWVAAGCGGSVRPELSLFPWGNPTAVSFNKHAKAELALARENLAKRGVQEKGNNQSASEATGEAATAPGQNVEGTTQAAEATTNAGVDAAAATDSAAPVVEQALAVGPEPEPEPEPEANTTGAKEPELESAGKKRKRGVGKKGKKGSNTVAKPGKKATVDTTDSAATVVEKVLNTEPEPATNDAEEEVGMDIGANEGKSRGKRARTSNVVATSHAQNTRSSRRATAGGPTATVSENADASNGSRGRTNTSRQTRSSRKT
ncbi:hypothetical protein FRC07_010674 [Ceratobasidium sp. 392]|nr:hypothetical protein FRC07_010674 [Ceratobasidium sp. 392]